MKWKPSGARVFAHLVLVFQPILASWLNQVEVDRSNRDGWLQDLRQQNANDWCGHCDDIAQRRSRVHYGDVQQSGSFGGQNFQIFSFLTNQQKGQNNVQSTRNGKTVSAGTYSPPYPAGLKDYDQGPSVKIGHKKTKSGSTRAAAPSRNANKSSREKKPSGSATVRGKERRLAGRYTKRPPGVASKEYHRDEQEDLRGHYGGNNEDYYEDYEGDYNDDEDYYDDDGEEEGRGKDYDSGEGREWQWRKRSPQSRFNERRRRRQRNSATPSQKLNSKPAISPKTAPDLRHPSPTAASSAKSQPQQRPLAKPQRFDWQKALKDAEGLVTGGEGDSDENFDAHLDVFDSLFGKQFDELEKLAKPIKGKALRSAGPQTVTSS